LIPIGVRAYLIGAIVSNSIIGAILVGLLIRTRGLSSLALLQALLPAAAASAVAFTGAWSANLYLPASLPTIAALFASWLIFSALSVFVLRGLFRRPLAELVGYFPGGQTIHRLLNL
jgi:hypothetical protein